MNESILSYIRKRCIGDEYEDDFDKDLVPIINMTLATLTQIGLGPSKGLFVEDEDTTWSDFISEDYSNSTILLGFTKEYLYCKTRLNFDPPSSTALVEALKRSADEYEQRIKIELETPTRKETYEQ